ncbi:hypothetical protein ACO0LD_19710 [Undibacterium sp. Ji83W]|uniref:hypothetical protein n=1 Tax=Undibacterium sp. Ji83W TaxID=3413043 RepID=UPI003BEFCFF6
MKRRSRSGTAESSEEFSGMSLEEINADIQRCQLFAEIGGSSQGRKAFFKRLVLLEKQRELLFEIEAPRRTFRQR